METARALWRTLETIHATIYFSPLAMEAYTAIGVGGPGHNYFAPRSAAMGAVDGGVVAGAFYFWEPSVVRRFLPDAWTLASPGDVVAARWGIARDVVLDRTGTIVTTDAAAQAAGLLEKAMSSVPISGRPVFGGHASVPCPDDPIAAVWHWSTLYREFRGDGHIAALQTLGISPIEALLLNIATGYWPEERQRKSRGWSLEVWASARNQLIEGDLLVIDDGGLALTETGTGLSKEIELLTNQLSMAPWAYLGQGGSDRVVELLEPWARAIVAAGGVGYERPEA